MTTKKSPKTAEKTAEKPAGGFHWPKEPGPQAPVFPAEYMHNGEPSVRRVAGAIVTMVAKMGSGGETIARSAVNLMANSVDGAPGDVRPLLRLLDTIARHDQATIRVMLDEAADARNVNVFVRNAHDIETADALTARVAEVNHLALLLVRATAYSGAHVEALLRGEKHETARALGCAVAGIRLPG